MKEQWAVLVVENGIAGVVRALCSHRSDAEMLADLWDGTVERRNAVGQRVCHVCWDYGIDTVADCMDVDDEQHRGLCAHHRIRRSIYPDEKVVE